MKRLEVTSSNLRNKSRKLLDIFRLSLRITQLLAMSTFALQADGNIDVVRLEKDLRNALDFDVKYKQTDNMKKKACKISADYDEFKAYVACAHLKTVRYSKSLFVAVYPDIPIGSHNSLFLM